MLEDDIELDDETPPSEPDSRIREMVEYAVSGVELLLNAEFLLDEWVTAYLRRNAMTAFIYRRHYMSPEEKYVLAAEECGLDLDDEDSVPEAYGFLLDIYRLRGRAARLSDEDLTESIIEAHIRHWGEETREECYLPLNLARQMIVEHLIFAEKWFSLFGETIPYLYDPDPVEDPGWEPNEGGSSNSITD